MGFCIYGNAKLIQEILCKKNPGSFPTPNQSLHLSTDVYKLNKGSTVVLTTQKRKDSLNLSSFDACTQLYTGLDSVEIG
jgi:hypothetical protein